MWMRLENGFDFVQIDSDLLTLNHIWNGFVFEATFCKWFLIKMAVWCQNPTWLRALCTNSIVMYAGAMFKVIDYNTSLFFSLTFNKTASR